MKIYYDLHIHSCLSPCAEEEMTPNNIVNMAMIKGLDVIAVADHNQSGNLKAILKVAAKRDMLVIPAMELQTVEEVHLLCLFRTLEAVEMVQKQISETQLPIPNRPEKFGHQYVMDDQDEIIGEVDVCLLFSSTMTIEGIVELVRSQGGLVIPAHINRQSNSVISNLGFIPEELNFGAVEVSGDAAGTLFLETFDNTKSYVVIRDSDAHQLFNISEREHYFELPERSIESIFQYLENRQQVER